MVQTITRRAALVGAVASTAALAAPVAAAVKPATIEALAEQFRKDAMALDPRINECWLGYDEVSGGPRDMRVMSLYFGRSATPFVRPTDSAPVDAPATISDLFAKWLEANRDDRAADETAEQFDVRWREYVALQRRITSMRPRTVREAAMQFVVETDDGSSEYRDAFYRRLRQLAVEG